MLNSSITIKDVFDKMTSDETLEKMKRTIGYTKEINCLMLECLNNIHNFCQCKADSITPNSQLCGKRQEKKGEVGGEITERRKVSG